MSPCDFFYSWVAAFSGTSCQYPVSLTFDHNFRIYITHIILLHKHLYNLHAPANIFFFPHPCTVHRDCLCLPISLVVLHSVCLYISLVIIWFMVSIKIFVFV